MFCRREKSVAPARIRTACCPAHSLVTIITTLSCYALCSVLSLKCGSKIFYLYNLIKVSQTFKQVIFTKSWHFSTDDDSEPILGLWFEETLAPPETPPGSNAAQSAADSQEGAGKHSTDRAGSIVPEKGEPHGVSVTFILQSE